MKESSYITRIFTNLSRFFAVFLLLGAVNLQAVDEPAEEVDNTPIALPADAPAEPAQEFDLPEFMGGDAPAQPVEKSPAEKAEIPVATTSTPVIAKDDDAVMSDIIPNDGDFTNKMSVGDVIVSPRQTLMKQPLADIRMEEVPIRDALRYLAEAAGINYVLPNLETENVTVNMRMPPFRAMEVLANNFGLGIYEEDGLWFIRKKDSAQYFAKIYKLHNIHLGESTSGAGSNSTTENTSSTTSSTTSRTTTGSTTDGTTPATGTPGSTSASGVGGQVVITTLQEILGIDVGFGGTIGPDGTIQTAAGSSAEPKKKDDKDTTNADYTYVSYSADANTLFIIATATQHQWVDQYLKAIDNPTNNIAIEAMFLESSLTPTEQLGFNWESASSLTLSTYGAMKNGTEANDENHLPAGTLGNPVFPWGALIQTNNFSASLSAFQKQTDSQVAHYPSVVTQNGREVKIETTQNIPLSATQRLVEADLQTGATVGIQDLGFQKIGTTIVITPRQINDEGLVQLTISINISTGTDATDTNTNRVATNDTSYTGTVNVPQGYTLAIGGLERIQDSISSSGVPGLSKIPLFGFMFKSKGKDNTRTSIFLFITPTIIKTSDARPNSFLRPSNGLSKDWIDKADDRHRAWRRDVIDPEVEKTLKNTGKD